MMMPRVAARYSLFLVLLILGQEFSLARYSDAPIHHGPSLRDGEHSFADARRDDDDDDDDEEEEEKDYNNEDIYSAEANLKPLPGDLDSDYSDVTEEDLKLFETKEEGSQIQTKTTTTIDKQEDDYDNEEEQASPGKRAILTTVLLAVAITAAMVDISFEIYFKIDGCCGTSDACKYKRMFQANKALMLKLNPQIDNRILMAKNFLTDILLVNGLMEILWQKVDHIMGLQEQLIHALDPNITNQFRQKWASIEAAIVAKNATVSRWTYATLSIQFDSMFDTVLGTIREINAITSFARGPLLLRAYKFVKRLYFDRQLTKSGFMHPSNKHYQQLATIRHSKSARFVGLDRVGLNKHMEQTRAGKLNAAVSGGVKPKWQLRLIKAYRVISTISTLVGVGMHIYRIIMNFKQCKDIASRAKDGALKMKAVVDMLKELKANMTDYNHFLERKGAQYIRRQLTDPQFLKTLTNIRDILAQSGKTSLSSRKAAAAIEKYLTDIQKAPFTKTYNITRSLITALSHAQLLYKCTLAKVQIQKFIIASCKRGDYNITRIYNEASNSWAAEEKKCLEKKGIRKYSFNDAKDAVKKAFNNTGFNTDCFLNSAAKKKEVCRLIRIDGKKLADTANQVAITVAQATWMLAHCATLHMRDKDKTLLCHVRAQNQWTDEKVHGQLLPFKYIALSEIKAYKCP